MVGLGRFELPTLGLGNQCSIHLSYSPRPTVYYSRGDALSRTQLYPNLYPTSPKAGGGGGQLWPMGESLPARFGLASQGETICRRAALLTKNFGRSCCV